MVYKLFWTIIIFLIFSNAIYFSIKLSFPQLSFKKMFSSLKKEDNSNINSINSLMMSLANKIGVGSLAGISFAIYYGGPGVIFWMWVFTIITSINTYLESYLGVLYKEKDGDFYKGGPSYYIKSGLNNKKLSLVYTVLIIFAYIFCFLTIQTNTISLLVNKTFDINIILIGLIITFLSFIFIFKGLKSISNLCSKIVPLMAFLYIICGLYVIFNNYLIIPNIFETILTDAFSIKSITLGSIYVAITKSIFATESGLGTSAIAVGADESLDCKKSSYIQILGVYFIGLVITTITAIIILSSNYNSLVFSNINGIELTRYAFNYHFGVLGDYLLNIILILFAFSTIITGYYYGESALKSINNKNIRIKVLILKITTLILLFLGSIIKPNIIWKLVDTIIMLLTVINVYSIYRLKDKIMIK